MKTHVCLVSAQPIPNVLPTQIEEEKPDQIVLLTSPEMKRQEELLLAFLQPRGFRCESVPIDAYDFSAAVAVCNDVLKRYGGVGEELTLNVTGGTKIAALAAFQQFYFASKRIIYTDTDNGCIRVLGDEPAKIPLADNLLNVEAYLACYGKQVVNPPPGVSTAEETARRRKLTQSLCELFVRDPDLLFRWNGILAARNSETAPFGVSLADLGNVGQSLYDLLVQGGAAEPAASTELTIPTEKLRFYLHGGWLEEYVYTTLLDMGVPGRACRLNVNIEWMAPGKRQPTRNELDVVFTHKNRLHVISCKTSDLGRGAVEPSGGKMALYELDSLTTAVGGIFARSMLVSVRQLTPAAVQRAKDARIEVVEGGAVLNLKDRLNARWQIGK